MRVLVTGGAGFIGSHVSEMLSEAGHSVIVIDNLQAGARENLPSSIRFITCDIVHPDTVPLVRDLSPHAIVHCAAHVSVSAAVADPQLDLRPNIVGTVNLMLGAKAAGTETFVFSSTAAVYGTPETLPIDEDHPTRPVSPYGVSKLAAEGYVRTFGDLHGMRCVTLRYANVLGPRQKGGGDGAVIPNFLGAMVNGSDPTIAGDGEQTRDFVYVKDVAAANLLAITRPVSGTFHISTGHGTTINELWRVAAEITGWDRPPCFGPARTGDIRHSVLSPARALQTLGWQASVDLASGLAATASYWRSRSAEGS